jgi:beta-galactosidase
VQLPRLGIRSGVSSADRVRWFAGGPVRCAQTGEVYPDKGRRLRWAVGSLTVDALQSPYVRPQRTAPTGWSWAACASRAIRVLPDGRRWTTE